MGSCGIRFNKGWEAGKLSQRPPAKRVVWILPPMVVKDRGAKCPNRWKQRGGTVDSRAKHPVWKTQLFASLFAS
jgi:hypothetical protein